MQRSNLFWYLKLPGVYDCLSDCLHLDGSRKSLKFFVSLKAGMTELAGKIACKFVIITKRHSQIFGVLSSHASFVSEQFEVLFNDLS